MPSKVRPGDNDHKHLDKTDENCPCIFSANSVAKYTSTSPCLRYIIRPTVLLSMRVHPHPETHRLDHLTACLYLVVDRSLSAENVHHLSPKRDMSLRPRARITHPPSIARITFFQPSDWTCEYTRVHPNPETHHLDHLTARRLQKPSGWECTSSQRCVTSPRCVTQATTATTTTAITLALPNKKPKIEGFAIIYLRLSLSATSNCYRWTRNTLSQMKAPPMTLFQLSLEVHEHGQGGASIQQWHQSSWIIDYVIQ